MASGSGANPFDFSDDDSDGIRSASAPAIW